MLREIFQAIATELQSELQSKGFGVKKSKVVIGPREAGSKAKSIHLEMLRFGADNHRKNYVGSGPGTKAYYAFTFFIVVNNPDYNEQLSLIENICEHFERKPFVHITIKGKELEMALSVLEVTFDEINRFWLAQQQPHQPVLFFQARVSEV